MLWARSSTRRARRLSSVLGGKLKLVVRVPDRGSRAVDLGGGGFLVLPSPMPGVPSGHFSDAIGQQCRGETSNRSAGLLPLDFLLCMAFGSLSCLARCPGGQPCPEQGPKEVQQAADQHCGHSIAFLDPSVPQRIIAPAEITASACWTPSPSDFRSEKDGVVRNDAVPACSCTAARAGQRTDLLPRGAACSRCRGK